jgi:DNA-binding CsgD family transcriptional regulator
MANLRNAAPMGCPHSTTGVPPRTLTPSMTAPQQPELLRAEIVRFATDPKWVREVSANIADAIHAELGVDPDIRPRTQATTESVLRLFAEMVERDEPLDQVRPPYETVDYAREFVMRGVPLESMVRAYHIGHAAFFEHWVAGLRARIEDPETLANVIEQGATWTFRYLQALTRDLIGHYATERERWVRNAASVRTDTVRALLVGEDIDPASASRRLRYELDRQHLAFVVWIDATDQQDGPAAALERHASGLASELGAPRALLVPLGGPLISGWIATPDDTMATSAKVQPPALAALGEPAPGVDGFCRSHRQAMSARRVARLARARPGTITRYADIAITALASVDEQAAHEFVAAELGALARRDDDILRLAATLRAYLEEHASPRRTARRLGVHENTIKNRVRAIQEVRGRPADQRVAETLLALRLTRLLDHD